MFAAEAPGFCCEASEFGEVAVEYQLKSFARRRPAQARVRHLQNWLVLIKAPLQGGACPTVTRMESYAFTFRGREPKGVMLASIGERGTRCHFHRMSVWSNSPTI